MSAWQIIKTFDEKWYVTRTHNRVREYLRPDGKVDKEKPYFYQAYWEASRTVMKFLPALGKQIENEYFTQSRYEGHKPGGRNHANYAHDSRASE